ncbi:MAG: TonB-dependent receptor plug domain-containing protein [Candidatus Riflebacteria bacterium]|nr:TonB-dependent receptor plug domain-containing protein [Candidatus Riflebacteria bacterium]
MSEYASSRGGFQTRPYVMFREYCNSLSYRHVFTLFLIFALWVLPVTCLWGKPLELSNLSIDELMKLEVIPVITSVSRRPEKVYETPAAVFVITAEDIRRSGAKTLPDILRLGPGINVARIDGSNWAISARGINDRFSRNLLVLIDGRSIYSPLFGGVWWDVQDTLLEDIERVEIVRGPGGTTWGANAVNGIVNVVTKSAKDTKGGLVSVGKSPDKSDFSYRYGANLEGNGAFRFYFKTFENDPFYKSNGNRGIDDYDQYRFGLRADWESSHSRQMTLDASAYGGNSHEEIVQEFSPRPPGHHGPAPLTTSQTSVSGGHFRVLLMQTFSPDSELKLQFYFDRARRIDANHEEYIDTLDLDLQHRFIPSRSQEIVWGFGYRSIKYSIPAGRTYEFTPPEDTIGIQSCFFQDQVTLKPQKLFWTFGTKIYHHPYVGTEGQPSTRLFWKPREKHNFWAALTESRRVPSIEEHSSNGKTLNISSGPGDEFQNQEIGNASQQSEIMRSEEFGYRYLPNKKISFDLALFKQDYSDLARAEFIRASDAGGLPPQIQQKNDGQLFLTGAELSFQWKPLKEFRLVGGMSENKESSDSYPVSVFSPRQLFMRTYWDVRKDLEFDLSYNDDFYETDSDNSSHRDSRNARNDILNVRLGWRPSTYFELSLTGQNLLHDRQREFPVDNGPANGDYVPSQIPRSYFLKATWFF